MKTVVICAALGVIALALFPPAMARQETAREEAPRVLVIEETIPAAAPQKATEPTDERTVTLLTPDGTRELELDEYLTAVVLCEMPPDFEPEALRELAESIGRYGILQPLTVRRGEDGYELIAGERRLRAAKLAGLREVPCLAVRSDEEESALLSLIENLQRQDLHYMEEAAAIAKLIAVYGLSQEQAAERLGKSQSAVANKLRLLRLSPACVTLLREGGLSERHARALLRLSDENERLAALRVIIERGCNVAQAEAYIESVLQRAAVTPPRRRSTFIVKDVRLFLNTIRRSMGIMQRAGVDAACEREDTDEEIRLTIRIPRTGAAKTA